METISWVVIMGLTYAHDMDLSEVYPNNHVRPTHCSAQDTICNFTLKIERRRTMAIYGRPPTSKLARDNLRLLRAEDGNVKIQYNDKCDHFENATEEELQKALIVDGGHGYVYTINGQFPGPTLVVYEGQQVSVKVINLLYQESLTMHWHGMLQKKSNWMDGVPGVTQCAIGPQESFMYRFIAEPSGTHWYHSHQGGQRSDGMYGALIVLPKSKDKADTNRHGVQNEKKVSRNQDTEKDFIFMVQDWYPEDSNLQFINFYNGLLKHNGSDQCYVPSVQADGTVIGPLEYSGAVINGKGFRTTHIKGLPLERFHVTYGQRYRFRIINTGLLYTFKVSFDQHQFRLIATDGNDVKPPNYMFDAVYVTPGERYDVILRANQMANSSYFIRVETLHWNPAEQSSDAFTVYGILDYTKTNAFPHSSQLDCNAARPCIHVNCPFRQFPESQHIECHNMEDLEAKKYSSIGDRKPDEEIFLNFHFANSTDDGIRSAINGIQHVQPTESTRLHERMYISDCANYDCDHQPCQCSHRVKVKANSVYHVVLFSQVWKSWKLDGALIGSSHPVHLHGHHFEVIQVGYPVYNESNQQFLSMNPEINCRNERCNKATWQNDVKDEDYSSATNVKNPPKKDTVHVPAGGYVVIRFETDNPGFWMLHCHIENHNLEGMALVLQVGEPEEMNDPPEHFPKCGTFELSPQEFQDAFDGKHKINPIYSTWIPALLAAVIVSNIANTLIVWKCTHTKGEKRRVSSAHQVEAENNMAPVVDRDIETSLSVDHSVIGQDTEPSETTHLL